MHFFLFNVRYAIIIKTFWKGWSFESNENFINTENSRVRSTEIFHKQEWKSGLFADESGKVPPPPNSAYSAHILLISIHNKKYLRLNVVNTLCLLLTFILILITNTRYTKSNTRDTGGQLQRNTRYTDMCIYSQNALSSEVLLLIEYLQHKHYHHYHISLDSSFSFQEVYAQKHQIWLIRAHLSREERDEFYLLITFQSYFSRFLGFQ
jgi:hypothetical protein